jgi:hypothetical protein
MACCCVDNCFFFSWLRESPDLNLRNCTPGLLGGTVTLELPDSYSVPSGGFEVTINATADDKVRVNGDWFGKENACSGSPLQKTFSVNTRTLEFSFYDTVSGNVGGSVCVCISGVFAPSFSRTALSASGGTLDISGWKLTYPSIPTPSLPFIPLQYYLDRSYAEPCNRLNPLP